MNSRKKNILISGFLMLLSISMNGQNILNISLNTIKDTLPIINNGYVVYQSVVSAQNSEIMLYTVATNGYTQVTNNSVQDINPHIGITKLTDSETSTTYLTWLHWDGNDYEVTCCKAESPSTVVYLTDDNIDQNQPFVTYIGIGWSQAVGNEVHVMMYFNSVTSDISSQFSSIPCSESYCTLKCVNSELVWLIKDQNDQYKPQILTSFSSGTYYVYGESYCGLTTRSFYGPMSGAGSIIATIADNNSLQKDVYAVIFANNADICVPVAASSDDESGAVSLGIGSDGKSHIAYIKTESSVPHIYRYIRDWYSISDVGSTMKLSSSNRAKNGLVGYKQFFAWFEIVAGKSDLFLYDGSSESQLTNTIEGESQVKFDETSFQANPEMVWISGIGNESEVYLNTNSQAVGIKEAEEKEMILVSPNPAADHLNILFPDRYESISVYNAIGQLMREFNAEEKEIDVSRWSNGMYELVLISREGKYDSSKLEIRH